jgi:PTS system mannose-specific IIA component
MPVRPLYVQESHLVIGLVVVSHASLADGLKDAAQMIVGPQELFRTVGMGPAADLDQLREEVEAAVAEVGGPAASLVLVDLLGGSPGNASAYLAVAGTPVVCGVSLPMLLEVLTAREDGDTTPRALAERAVDAGRESIFDLGHRLAGLGERQYS